jgi:hypothetical protein
MLKASFRVIKFSSDQIYAQKPPSRLHGSQGSVARKDRLAAIAALGHVMRKSSGNDAAETCHSGIVRHSGNLVQ